MVMDTLSVILQDTWESGYNKIHLDLSHSFLMPSYGVALITAFPAHVFIFLILPFVFCIILGLVFMHHFVRTFLFPRFSSISLVLTGTGALLYLGRFLF